MANKIQIKRSKTAGKKPTTLAEGELALNLPDEKLFTSDGAKIIELTPEYATVDELLGGTDNTKAITPKVLADGSATAIKPDEITISQTNPLGKQTLEFTLSGGPTTFVTKLTFGLSRMNTSRDDYLYKTVKLDVPVGTTITQLRDNIVTKLQKITGYATITSTGNNMFTVDFGVGYLQGSVVLINFAQSLANQYVRASSDGHIDDHFVIRDVQTYYLLDAAGHGDFQTFDEISDFFNNNLFEADGAIRIYINDGNYIINDCISCSLPITFYGITKKMPKISINSSGIFYNIKYLTLFKIDFDITNLTGRSRYFANKCHNLDIYRCNFENTGNALDPTCVLFKNSVKVTIKGCKFKKIPTIAETEILELPSDRHDRTVTVTDVTTVGIIKQKVVMDDSDKLITKNTTNLWKDLAGNTSKITNGFLKGGQLILDKKAKQKGVIFNAPPTAPADAAESLVALNATGKIDSGFLSINGGTY
jgi:hypothetical protein